MSGCDQCRKRRRKGGEDGWKRTDDMVMLKIFKMIGGDQCAYIMMQRGRMVGGGGGQR